MGFTCFSKRSFCLFPNRTHPWRFFFSKIIAKKKKKEKKVGNPTLLPIRGGGRIATNPVEERCGYPSFMRGGWVAPDPPSSTAG
jgi:hypothetical protein